MTPAAAARVDFNWNRSDNILADERRRVCNLLQQQRQERGAAVTQRGGRAVWLEDNGPRLKRRQLAVSELRVRRWYCHAVLIDALRGERKRCLGP